MIHFSYTGQGATLCGGAVDHKTDLKDGKLCDACIQIMWKEQYRRNTLNKLVKPLKKKGIKRLETPIALPPHRGIASKKLFLKDWRTYSA